VGQRLLVFKADPITFASEEIAWYLVQVNANDLATTGAHPRWLLVTMLLPEGQTTPRLVQGIATGLNAACREIGASVIGGHTEVTHGPGDRADGRTHRFKSKYFDDFLSFCKRPSKMGY
jgi:hydrogenase expression/formation protein HypE